MTVTVKLDPVLEERLRQRAAAHGATTSEVIRAALVAYLDTPDSAEPASAHALGADLFGRHRGAPDLAHKRKAILADAWSDKQRARC